MQSHTRTHHSFHTRHWDPAQVTIAVLVTLLLLIFLLLFLTLTAPPAWGQTAVPPTAVQAAKLPQFAAKLAHSSRAGASRLPVQPKATDRPGGKHTQRWLGSPLDTVLYDNGPINGTTDAWTINYGYVTSDSFTVQQQSNLSSINFGAWLFPGDVLQSVQVSITSSEFGGTIFFDGIVNFTQSGCFSNQYGYNVCTESGSLSVGLNAGNYWVNLQNATVNTGDPVFWDENSGPSMASQSSVGTIPSESFSIMNQTITCGSPEKTERASDANVVTTPPSPSQTFRVIYNFTGGADGSAPQNGLTVDAAGNLYGTAGGGPFGAGTAFKLSPTLSGWRYTRLFSFSGQDGSSPSSPLAQAATGVLYGTTGSGGCCGDGALFGLAPPSHMWPSVFSTWRQTLLHGFTGGTDGASPGGTLAFDSSGNIFGSTSAGGANGQGTLYSFANGGLNVLHAFPASSNDGTAPFGVVSSQGRLYGLTAGGGRNGGGTVYTWNGIYQRAHDFQPDYTEGIPVSLAADHAGNIYVTTTWAQTGVCGSGGGEVIQLSYPLWNATQIYSWWLWYAQHGVTSWVSTDSSGNVYGTTAESGIYGAGNVFKLTCCWTYTNLYDFTGAIDGANPTASPVVDSHGNIFGTTESGGSYGYGVIWEITP
jgi:uncharacterized repeat protein (TIGR03803 family)